MYRRIAASLSWVSAAFVILVSSDLSAQQLYNIPVQKENVTDDDPRSYVKDMDDLMHTRLERERAAYRNGQLVPEVLRVEGNYIRTDAPTGNIVLYESSFHLEPRYLSFSPLGREAGDSASSAPQSVMYFTGIARTPLALPLVSNLSKVLSGDEASYSIYLGILPLPHPADRANDSLRFYCVIERAIESNRSESEKKFERYAKEFSFKIGEPIQLRLDNTPPDRQVYIIKIEDNSEPLNFYEDFARHFQEHIILNGERLSFNLQKANVSMVSPRVSIPYSVGQMAHIKLDLLSVVDEAHPLTLVDSVMRPAEYLAECDIRDFVNGTYRYRITAKEIGTGKVLFTDIKEFEKKQPVMVGHGVNLANTDTLEVGGKKASAEKQLQALNSALVLEKVRTERLEATNSLLASENKGMRSTLDAQKGDVIAGVRGRSGMGFGRSTGINLFIGAESISPALTIDASFGLLYSSNVPYLDYEAPQNFSQIFQLPKSIGLQIGWAPMSLLGGILSPVVRLGYYGIFSKETASTAGGRHSATLIEPAVGITSTPGGAGTNFGFDFTIGPSFGLGINEPAEFDVQAKFYLRF